MSCLTRGRVDHDLCERHDTRDLLFGLVTHLTANGENRTVRCLLLYCGSKTLTRTDEVMHFDIDMLTIPALKKADNRIAYLLVQSNDGSFIYHVLPHLIQFP